MRWPCLVTLVVVVGCSGPSAAPVSSPARPSPTSSHPVHLSAGGVVEYPLPAVAPDCAPPCHPSLGSITRGADGNIWYVDGQQQLVGRITPAGTIAQFKMPVELAGGAQTITSGQDGNIWVLGRGHSSSDPDWVLRVGVDGQVTKFPTPSVYAGTESIARGPDGNVWFTEFWTGRVARVTPSGAITEFQIPNQGAGPRGIVSGRDGNLWFAEDVHNPQTIGRMTPDGVVTEFTVGQGDSTPDDVIAGPDGNIWFSRWLGDSLGRITPNGQFTPVVLPQGSKTVQLTSGPDGNIWFTDSGANAIGRMSVAGAVREFPLPRRNAYPYGIAVGGDGRIWFGEGDRIGSIGLTVPQPSFSDRVLIFADASSRRVAVTNTGEAALVLGIVKVAGVDSNAFAKTADTCSGRTLPPAAKCEVIIARDTSASTDVQSAQLEFPDNGTGSPQKVSLVAQLRSCKLPVVDSAPNMPAQGAMLDTTSGREIYEPRGSFASTASPARVKTVTEPVLTGVSSGYYDRSAARWLPVPSADSVSPDGSRYAYIPYDDPGTTRTLRIVDVATGSEKALPLTTGFWTVVAFTDRGVYIHQAYEGIGPGLWLVDPDSGSMRQVLDSGAVNLVVGTTAWFGDRNPADTLAQWGMGGGSNEIGSKDLVSGATQTWLYVPGTLMYVVATYNGAPVVSVADQTSMQFFAVTAPNQPEAIELPFTNDANPSLSGFVSDPHGLWIGSLDGVYLWTARTGGILVSTLPATPAGSCA